MADETTGFRQTPRSGSLTSTSVDGVTEHIDTWGSLNMDAAIARAQELVASQGDVGDTYELLEVTVQRRVVVRAQRVGVIQD